MIDQKNVTAKTANKSMEKPVCQEISIQAEGLINEKDENGIDLSDLPPQFVNNSSNLTNNYFPKVDMSVQGNLDRGVSHSVQITNRANDVSVHKSYRVNKDISIQPSQQYKDYELQYGAEMMDEQVQPTLVVDKEEIAIQYENEMDYDEFEEELKNSNAGTNVIFDHLD